MKKFLIWIASLVSCCLAAWNGQMSETEPAVIEVVEGSDYEVYAGLIYEISTPEELAWFADQVNNQDNAAIVGVLKNDIVFGADTSVISEYPWIPIGRDKNTPFKGAFDGAGHRVYGLNVSVTDNSYVGLFGKVESKGTIKNLTVANYHLEVIVDTLTQDNIKFPSLYMGAIAGFSDGTAYENCHSRGGSVSYEIGNEEVYSGSAVGGLIGRVLNGSVTDCSNSTDLDLVAFATLYGGGIVGYISSEDISRCTNSGNVTSHEDDVYGYAFAYLGGVVGYGSGIANSINTGNVIADKGQVGGISASANSITTSQNYGSVSGDVAGGLSGVISGSVYKSLNEGDVYGRLSAGGIACDIGSTAVGVINGGAVSGDTVAGMFVQNRALVINSYARSRSLSGISYTAGFVVRNKREMYFSYFDSTLAPHVPFVSLDESENPSFDVGPMSTEDMQQAAFAYRLTNFSAFQWDLFSAPDIKLKNDVSWSFDGGYPFFADEKNLPVFKILKDDGVEINEAYTDAQGYLLNIDPAYSEENHYFAGWFDSTGTQVSRTTEFAGDETIFAKYTESVEDSALVVAKPEESASLVMGWNGKIEIPAKKIRKDSSIYVVIRTPSELVWYTRIGAPDLPYVILGNDIVMGKDTLSVMDTTIQIRHRYAWFNENSILDGDGHTIYGLSQSLFTYALGTIKNLHLANPLLSPGFGAFSDTNEGLIVDCSVRRPVLKVFHDGNWSPRYSSFVHHNKGVIENCQNEYDMEVYVTDEYGVFLCGATAMNYGTIKNFKNSGKVVIYGEADENNSYKSSYSRFAGVTVENGGQVLYCRNEASYDWYDASGSVVGIASDGTILASENVADFTAVMTKGENEVSMTGIGYGSIDSCVNTGNMTVSFGDSAKVTAGLYGIGSGDVKNSVNKGNLYIKDESDSAAVLGHIHVGGITGEGKVDSCVNYGNIEYSAKNFSQAAYASSNTSVFGGLASSVMDTIRNSSNEGTVIGIGTVGGIVGRYSQPRDYGYMENVVNHGKVASYGVGYDRISSKTYVGGIAGICGDMDNVRNEGSVEGVILHDVEHDLYVGGICGEHEVGLLKRVANVGSVTARTEGKSISHAAGIAAYAWGRIENSYNWGDVESSHYAGGLTYSPFGISIKNTYSASKVIGLKAGAVDAHGEVRNPHLENGSLYYTSGKVLLYQGDFVPTVFYDSSLVTDTLHVMYGEDFSYRAVPMGTSEMQSDDFVLTLNTSAGTAKSSGIWTREEGYPVFDANYGMTEPEESSSSTAEESSSSQVVDESSSSSSDIPLSLNPTIAFDLSIAVEGRQILLNNVNHHGKFILMNSLGHRIAVGQINGSQARIAVPQAGVYILRVGSFSKRVVIK